MDNLGKLINEILLSNVELTWKDVSIILGKNYGIIKTPNAVRKTYYRYIKNNPEQEIKVDLKKVEKQEEVKENFKNFVSIEKLANGMTVSDRSLLMSEQQAKDEKFILEAHGFDPNEFELVSAKNNFWTGQGKDNEIIHHYQSKITVKKRNPYNLTKQEIAELNAEIKPFDANRFKLKPIKQNDLMLEVDFSDTHIGSLSWAAEAGEDYDYKIVFENVMRQVAEARYYIDLFNVSQVNICFLGDFVHIDSEEGETTGGTRVDTDTRPKKIIQKARELIMYIIENLAVVPTEVYWIEGNHSRLIEFTIIDAMPFIYQNAKHIKFDVSPRLRKAFMYGNNLVGLHHGEMKKDQMFNWLQVEFRELWGKAKYAEQHSGHIHQEQVVEKGGIINRTNPTGKAPDMYETRNGWKSEKAAVAYLWSKTDKLKGQFYLR